MSQVNPDVKAALVANGRWGDFVRAKADLDAAGVPPVEARRRALEAVAPEIVAGMPVKRSRGRPRKEEKDAIVAACGGGRQKTDAEPKRGDGGVREQEHSRNQQAQALRREDFDGRACSMREAVTWVLSNLCFDPSTVDRSQAPSALAVTYYDACVSSLSFKADFMLKVGPMLLPKKFEEERNDGDEFTGKAEYDILGAIAGGAE